jgi:CelD/BcsL family acetyltransferase involved in cellulose biosynthesis
LITEIITSLTSLSSLESHWDKLLGESVFRTPFQTFTWQYAVAEYKEEPDNLFIVAVYDDQVLIGLAPLCRDEMPGGKRILRWLGATAGICDYQVFLIRKGRETDFYSSLFKTLREHSSEWDEIWLSEVPSTMVETSNMMSHIHAAGLHLHTLHESVTCRMPLPATWEEYLTTVSTKFRGTLENKARNITKMPEIQLVDLAGTDQWQAGMEALYDLHQQRWTSKGENGVFANESTRRMHLEIVEKFRRLGMVRLLAFVAGEEILAINYSLCMEDTNYSYLSSYTLDDTWSKYSMGVQIRRASIYHAVETGMKVYDFLRGDESYKLSFGAVPAQNLDLHIFSSKPRFLLFKTINRLKSYKLPVPAPIKQFLKDRILNH